MAMFKVFALGSNSSGQLGIGSYEDTTVPKNCVFDAEAFKSPSETGSVVKIVAGGSHTLLLVSSGAVFAAGNNEDGQCGLPQTKSLSRTDKFHQVVLECEDGDNIEKFSDIAATWSGSFLVENGARIYVLGSGSRGELGLGERVVKTQPRAFIELKELSGKPSKISSISGSMNHVAILTAEGEAFGWGASKNGQLGQESRKERSYWKPTRILLPFRASRVVTGRDFTFFSDNVGRDIMLGKGKHTDNYSTLGQLDQLAAGWSHIYILSKGRVEAIGRGDRGQLPPKNLPDMKAISAGSEHCLGLTTAGDVIAWGWAEHGNCGVPIDASGNVASRWNHIPVMLGPNESVTVVGAGCATSFIVAEAQEEAT